MKRKRIASTFTMKVGTKKNSMKKEDIEKIQFESMVGYLGRFREDVFQRESLKFLSID